MRLAIVFMLLGTVAVVAVGGMITVMIAGNPAQAVEAVGLILPGPLALAAVTLGLYLGQSKD